MYGKLTKNMTVYRIAKPSQPPSVLLRPQQPSYAVVLAKNVVIDLAAACMSASLPVAIASPCLPG